MNLSSRNEKSLASLPSGQDDSKSDEIAHSLGTDASESTITELETEIWIQGTRSLPRCCRTSYNERHKGVIPGSRALRGDAQPIACFSSRLILSMEGEGTRRVGGSFAM
jgi:hypothetical protein